MRQFSCFWELLYYSRGDGCFSCPIELNTEASTQCWQSTVETWCFCGPAWSVRKLVFDFFFFFGKLVSELLLWVGDSLRLPDPVSVETAVWVGIALGWVGKKKSVNVFRCGGGRLWGLGRWGDDKGRDYLNTCYNSTTHTSSANGPATGCFGSQNKDRVSHPSMQILCQS